MSSIARRMKRNLKKQLGTLEPAVQQYQDTPDGGRAVLHATKGWRKVSPKRLKLYN